MATPRPFIQRFFEQYEKGANTFDPDLVTSQFANDFLDAGPKGVFHGRNDEEFRRVIPERKEFMAGIGFQKAEIISLDETILNDFYSMVNVGWRMTFTGDGGAPKVAEFEILYFLFVQNEDPKVVMYISHDDEQETMEEMGLL